MRIPHTMLAIPPRIPYTARRMGTLNYGENLDIHRRYVADASVDLVNLDL